jgi:hypothetical protein
MADLVKQIFHKKYTPAEIGAGNIASVTTDATTALVIKDVNVAHSDGSTSHPLATLSVGTTADLAATPSKFINLGTISSSTTKGVSGSEIVDVSSTLSVRVPAQPINFVDYRHSSLAYITTSNITQCQGIELSVNKIPEPVGEQTVQTSTTFSATTTGAGTMDYSGNFRQFVTNTITNLKHFFTVLNNRGGQTNLIYTGSFDGTTHYLTGHGTGNRPWDYDGRFLVAPDNTTRFQYHDLKGAASRSPHTGTHGYVDLYNKAGTALTRPTMGGSYAIHNMAYFSDNGKRMSVHSSAYNKEVFLVEWPDYTTESLAWSSPNNRTTGFWLLANAAQTSSNGSYGPNSNRSSPGYIRATYSQSNYRQNWFIGTTAYSKTKRILIFSNGHATQHSNTLYFFWADTDHMHQSSFTSSSNSYSVDVNDANLLLGWHTSYLAGGNWVNSGNTASITAAAFRGRTGSSASWTHTSQFYLDQDILTFTNSMSAGNGPGPIVSWNMKTNEVTAAGGLTWAKYVDSSGTALANPGAGETEGFVIGHRSFASAPSSTQISGRSYTVAPELEVRITAVEESR